MYEVLISFEYDYQDVAHEIAGEMQAIPDLLVGNYSDGNLVASLLAHRLGVTTVRFIFQPWRQFLLQTRA